MKVILLKDVKNLGKKNEIKNVSPGHGRNLLIKNNLAKVATDKDIKEAEKMQEISKKREVEKKEKIKETAKKISGMSFDIKLKVGEKETPFESVTAKKIAERIRQSGFDSIEEMNIELKNPIKALGEYLIKLKFKQGEETTIKLNIVKENEKK